MRFCSFASIEFTAFVFFFVHCFRPIHSTLLSIIRFYCHFSYQCNNGMAKLMLLSIYFYYNSTASLALIVPSVMHHNEVMQFEHDRLFLSAFPLVCVFVSLFNAFILFANTFAEFTMTTNKKEKLQCIFIGGKSITS